MLTSQKIEAHLSYAYLHAVASHSGIICVKTGEDEDDAGVDVVLRVTGRLTENSILTNFTVDLQLKATVAQAVDREGRYAFPLKMKNYNELRCTKTSSPQLLVVLYLPANREEWLTHSHESLVARRSSLRLLAQPQGRARER